MMRALRRALYAVRGSMRQVRALLQKRKVERELAEELAHHVAMETEQNLARGMAPVEARRAALVAFGGVERYAEQVREARWTRWLEDVAHDVRYAWRTLGRSRAFTLAVVVTLGLGIGANAALYGLVDALIFRTPAGVPPSDALVRLESGRLNRLAYADLVDVRHGAADVIDIAGYQGTAVGLTADEPIRVDAQLVTGNFFDVLGIAPARGRFFVPSEDEVRARDAVVVISHHIWQLQFAGSDDVVGSTIGVNGHPFRVIGVAPAGFRGLKVDELADAWLPFMTQPLTMPRTYDVLNDRSVPLVDAVGRLRAGVTGEGAEAVLQGAVARLPEVKRFDVPRLTVTPLRGWVPVSDLSSEAATMGFALILTVLVLLMCCANVANLQFARSLGRRREIAVRLALGAGRGRLVRLLVTESLLLACAAGTLGVLLSFWLAQWLQVRFGGPFAALDVSPHARTLAFTFVLAVAAGFAFGLAPALRAARPGLMPSIKGSDLERPVGTRLRGMLVGAQVALSVVLVMAAGLFVVRMDQIGDIDPGFDAGRLVSFSVDLHANGYDEARRGEFFEELRRRLQTLPGVVSVAAPTYVPLTWGAVGMSVSKATGAADAAAGFEFASVAGVSGSFFTTLGVTPMRGRTLDDTDMRADRKRAVISEALARRVWGDASPVGHTMELDGDVVEVVGTIDELSLGNLADPSPMQVYLPENKHVQWAAQNVLVRTAGPPAAVMPRIRSELRRMDSSLPVFEVKVLSEEAERQIGTQRVLTRLVGMFGLLALLLAALGLYGVIASTVAARTREIGVRMALGARGRDVTRLFVAKGLRVVLYGVAAGMLLALGMGRLISSIVWGVQPFDPVVLAVTALALLAAAAVASWLPARRAAKVDPMLTLRQE